MQCYLVPISDLNLPPVLIKPSVDNETTAVEKIDENLGANSVFYKLEASDPDDDPCTFEVEWENGVGDDVFFVDPTSRSQRKYYSIPDKVLVQ